MLSDLQRPLTDNERVLLRKQIARLERERTRRLKLAIWVLGGFGLVGCLWTLAASNAPLVVVVSVWSGLVLGLTPWTRRDIRREIAARVRFYEQALSGGHAREVTIVATAIASFPDADLEVFQVEEDKMISVLAEELAFRRSWLSPNVSILQLRTETGETVWESGKAEGLRMEPMITIRGKELRKLRSPGHLEVLEGRLNDLHRILQRDPAK